MMEWKKFLSRKLGVSGGAIGVVAALPLPPLAKGIIIGAITLGYVIMEGIADIKSRNSGKETKAE